MAELQPIRRALVSVYDKTGLVELGQALAEAGVQIVSTGSTAARLAEAGVPVTAVEELTGFPECLDGRVKTLHPRVHAGILADRRLESHRAQLAELGVEPFDLVVVNDIDRFHLMADVVERVPELGASVGRVRQAVRDKLAEHKRYIAEHGEEQREDKE